MINDPNPKDDPQLESFCEWLYTDGHKPHSRSLLELKEIWLLGLYSWHQANGNKLPAREAQKALLALEQTRDLLCAFHRDYPGKYQEETKLALKNGLAVLEEAKQP